MVDGLFDLNIDMMKSGYAPNIPLKPSEFLTHSIQSNCS